MKNPKNPRRSIPFEFVLEALSGLELHTRPMFGCTAVYVASKIVLVLRKKEASDQDTGVWVCIPDEHVAAMKERYRMLRGVSFFEDPNSAWQVLHESDPAFEDTALELCSMIKKGTPLIGRVPKVKSKSKSKKKSKRGS